MGTPLDGVGKPQRVIQVDENGDYVAPGGGGGGDASATNQVAVQANAGSDATKAVAVQGITGGKAVPVSAASLPLPTGAASSTKQDDQTAVLNSILAGVQENTIVITFANATDLTDGKCFEDSRGLSLGTDATSVSAWCSFFEAATGTITNAVVSGASVTLTVALPFVLPNNCYRTSSYIRKWVDKGSLIVGAGNSGFYESGILQIATSLPQAGASFACNCGNLTTFYATAPFFEASEGYLALCSSLKTARVNVRNLPVDSFNNSTALEYPQVTGVQYMANGCFTGTGAWDFSFPECLGFGDNCLKDVAYLEKLRVPLAKSAGLNFLANASTGGSSFALDLSSMEAVGAGSFTGISGKTVTATVHIALTKTAEWQAFVAANTVTVKVVGADLPFEKTYTSGDLTSTATTGAAMACDGAQSVSLTFKLGTASTVPALQVQGSDDGTNWYSLGAPLTGTASDTVTTSINGINPKNVRWKVSTAGATIGAGWSIIMRAK